MRTSWARPRAGCQHVPTGRESRIPGSPEKPDPKEHPRGTSSAAAARNRVQSPSGRRALSLAGCAELQGHVKFAGGNRVDGNVIDDIGSKITVLGIGNHRPVPLPATEAMEAAGPTPLVRTHPEALRPPAHRRRDV